MFRGVALAPVTARLGRHGHLPTVLFAGVPVAVVSPAAAITGQPGHTGVDVALTRALAGLAAASPAGDESATAPTRRAARSSTAPTRPSRQRPGGRAASVHPPDGFPGRAAGPGAKVHGAVGGPSRLVHHDSGVLSLPGSWSPVPAPALPTAAPRAAARRVDAPPDAVASTIRSFIAIPTPVPAQDAPMPTRRYVAPVDVCRDEATAALLRSLVTPDDTARAATSQAATAPTATGMTNRRHSSTGEATRPDTTCEDTPTARPAMSPRPTGVAGPAPQPRLPDATLATSAPGGLVELVRWWESAAPPESGSTDPASTTRTPIAPSTDVPAPLGSRADDPHTNDRGAVDADPLSLFRDALELVLLDEALADGLVVG